MRRKLDARSQGDRARWMSALAPLMGARAEPILTWATAATLGGILAMKALWITLGVGLLLVVGFGLRGLLEPTDPRDVLSPSGDRRGFAEPEALARTEPRLPPEEESVRESLVAVPEAPDRTPESGVVAARGSLAVRLVWEQSGAPAEGIEVLLRFPEDEARIPRRASSDRAGQLRFEDLPDGEVRLEASHGGESSARIRVGEESFCELWIPAGLAVDGLVVDADGHPVEGAGIWIRRPGEDGWVGTLATRSAADGRFRLRSISRNRSIGARAAGHSPSLVEPLGGYLSEADEGVRITLRLRGAGGSVEGWVFDPEGQPLAEARVILGSPCRHGSGADGTFVHVAPPAVLVTDDRGRFEASGVEPGLLEHYVLASGFPVHEGITEVDPRVRVRLEVHLRVGGSVRGTVRSIDGKPAAGARVSLLGRDGRELSTCGFGIPSARADGAGNFVLGPLGAGMLHLRAQSEGGAVGRAQIELRLAEGEEVSWDPVLGEAHVVHGWVMTSEGLPLENWVVELTAESGAKERARSDAAGSFQLGHPEAGPYSIGTSPEPRLFDHHVLVRDGVSANSGEVSLVVERETRASATVLGSFEDTGRRAGEQMSLEAYLLSGFQVLATTPLQGGTFRLGPLVPGVYRLQIRSGMRTLFSSDDFLLKADETRDLGRLVSEATGSVTLEVSAEGSLAKPIDRLKLVLVNWERMLVHHLRSEDGAYRAPEIAPGTYTLLISEERVTGRIPRIEVRSGESTRAQLTLRPALYHLFVLRAPRGAEPWTHMRLEVRDGSGAPTYEIGVAMPFDPEHDFPFGAPLGLGRSTLLIETDTGLRATRTVEVIDLEQDPGEPMELVLH